jgi:hypothetical protein
MYLAILLVVLALAAVVAVLYLQSRNRAEGTAGNAQDGVTARQLPEREPERWTTDADGKPVPRGEDT